MGDGDIGQHFPDSDPRYRGADSRVFLRVVAERMRAAGFDEAALARIHAPIGLDIGAVSPAEIAVSIAGEIIAALRKKPLRSERAAP